MRSPPEDAWHGAYAIFFLQGIGQLFPYNAFINAEDYFRRRFCGSSFETSFENFFLLGYNAVSILALALALRYQDRLGVRSRIMGSLAVSALAFVVCALLVVTEGASASFLFWVTVLCILISGLSVAILQGGLFAMASAFPPRYTQAMMAGQGLAGLVVALAGIFTTLAGPDDKSCVEPDSLVDADLDQLAVDSFYPRREMTQQQGPPNLAEMAAIDDVVFRSSAEFSACAPYSADWSTLVYFTIAVTVLLGCMASYPVLERLPVTTYYMQPDAMGGIASSVKTPPGNGGGVGSGCGSCGNNSNWRTCGGGSSNSAVLSPVASMHRRLVERHSPGLLSPGKPLSDGDTILLHEDEENGDESNGGGCAVATADNDVRSTFRKLRNNLAPISKYAFSVFMVFAVTLSVFPGATSEVTSSRRCQPGRARFFAGDIFVLFSFVSFNAFDFMGRLAAGASIVMPAGWLPSASILRLAFVPLFLACRSEKSRLRQWLSADAYPLIIMPLFAVTNGYVGSLSMMAGSQKGAWASTAMVLFLSSGLLVGSLLSFLVLFVSTGGVG